MSPTPNTPPASLVPVVVYEPIAAPPPDNTLRRYLAAQADLLARTEGRAPADAIRKAAAAFIDEMTGNADDRMLPIRLFCLAASADNRDDFTPLPLPPA
jgi:hypothetical protein